MPQYRRKNDGCRISIGGIGFVPPGKVITLKNPLHKSQVGFFDLLDEDAVPPVPFIAAVQAQPPESSTLRGASTITPVFDEASFLPPSTPLTAQTAEDNIRSILDSAAATESAPAEDATNEQIEPAANEDLASEPPADAEPDEADEDGAEDTHEPAHESTDTPADAPAVTSGKQGKRNRRKNRRAQ